MGKRAGKVLGMLPSFQETGERSVCVSPDFFPQRRHFYRMRAVVALCLKTRILIEANKGLFAGEREMS